MSQEGNLKTYIIFFDESGDPNMEKIDLQYPVFGVGAVIYEKNYFYQTIVPSFQKLKIKHEFSENTVFHSSDIRKQKNEFARLTHYESRKRLMKDIGKFFQNSEMTIISSVIKKIKLKENYISPGCPYDLAFQFILERLEHFLRNNDAIAEMYLEKRIENVEPLKKVFCRLKENGNGYMSNKNFQKVFPQDDLVFVKKDNIGTQIVDLIIYPITSKVLRNKENIAFDIISKKFYAGNFGNTSKYGFKIFP